MDDDGKECVLIIRWYVTSGFRGEKSGETGFVIGPLTREVAVKWLQEERYEQKSPLSDEWNQGLGTLTVNVGGMTHHLRNSWAYISPLTGVNDVFISTIPQLPI